jgi:hypothetical protein
MAAASAAAAAAAAAAALNGKEKAAPGAPRQKMQVHFLGVVHFLSH